MQFQFTLIATDQNDKLRKEIQDEERENAKIMIQAELASAREGLEIEREKGMHRHARKKERIFSLVYCY